MLEIVAGEHDQRPLGRELAIDQRLADAARGIERLRIGDMAPLAAVHALGDEGALRRDAGKMHELFREARGIGREHFRRACDDRAIGPALDLDPRIPELYLPLRRW